jgi:hypothetical protein
MRYAILVAAMLAIAGPAAADPGSLGKEFRFRANVLEYRPGERRQPWSAFGFANIVAVENDSFGQFAGGNQKVPIGRGRSKTARAGVEVQGKLTMLNDGNIRLDFRFTVDAGWNPELPEQSRRYLTVLRPGQTAKLHFQRTSDHRQFWVLVTVDAVKD